MDPKELTDEQKQRLKSCKNAAELKSMLNDMGVVLTDEQLEEAAGGEVWYACNCYSPGTYGE